MSAEKIYALWAIVAGENLDIWRDDPDLKRCALFLKCADLELSTRFFKRISPNMYIGDLVQKSDFYILSTAGLGRKNLAALKDALWDLGEHHLGMEVPNWPPANLEACHEFAMALTMLESFKRDRFPDSHGRIVRFTKKIKQHFLDAGCEVDDRGEILVFGCQIKSAAQRAERLLRMSKSSPAKADAV